MPCAFDLQALTTALAEVADRRARRGVRYPLAPLLALAVCAKLAGQSRITALAHWAQLRAAELYAIFGLTRSTMPHPSTWSRLLGRAVDVSALEQHLGQFFQQRHPSSDIPARGSIILAVDGNPLRGTIPAGHTRGVHVVAAYLPEHGVVLAHLAVDRKEHEIVMVPTLLARFDLTGIVVVGAAMQTQRQRSIQSVEAGGDYLWFVKDNQPTLYADIERLFTPLPALPGTSDAPTDFTTAHQIDSAHGRLEERRITVSSWLHDYSDWPYLAQVFKLERTIWRTGKPVQEVRYGVTSLPMRVADAKHVLRIARAEWGIENGLHERRDVSLAEDASRLGRGDGPQVMAALNNAVIGLVLGTKERNLAAVQRRFAFEFDRYLARRSLQP